jgi:hypothetical protein
VTIGVRHVRGCKVDAHTPLFFFFFFFFGGDRGAYLGNKNTSVLIFYFSRENPEIS